MSTPDAIAAVTQTLTALLRKGLEDLNPVVDSYPPHIAAKENIPDNRGRVNLFLYQTTVNTAFSNMGLPLEPPPLALNLYYLLTPYTEKNNALDHRLLGGAMSILHDNAVLDRASIDAVEHDGSLHEQVESVRITPQPLTLDEMSKLWTAFQSEYRISVAYQVSVVLIDSKREAKSPVPVLRRGAGDEGVSSQPDLIPPFPTVTSLELPDRQPFLHFREETIDSNKVIVGDGLTIRGHHLAGDEVTVRLTHHNLPESIEIPPQPGATDTQVTIKLSGSSEQETSAIHQSIARYLAGPYRLAIVITQAAELGEERTRTTDEKSFDLAPRVLVPEGQDNLDGNIDQDDGQITMRLQCRPPVSPKQRVALLLGKYEFSQFKLSPTANPDRTEIEFDITDVRAGKYLVRLRVDGVNGLPIQDFKATSLEYDEKRRVTVFPKITLPGNPIAVHDGQRILTLGCNPKVWPTQRTVLLLDGQEILAQPYPKATAKLTFNITGIAAGEYALRLRVDEVVSLPDPHLKVTIE